VNTLKVYQTVAGCIKCRPWLESIRLPHVPFILHNGLSERFLFLPTYGGFAMPQAQAILTGALLIAVGLYIANAIQPAAAYGGGGPFQLMHHSNTAANAGVFRIDTTTGEVSYCYVTGSSGIDIMCSRPVR
jgi:hypothetical protein